MYIADSARLRSLSDARSLRSESIFPSSLITSRTKFAWFTNKTTQSHDLKAARYGGAAEKIPQSYCASVCRLAARALVFCFVFFVPFVVDRF